MFDEYYPSPPSLLLCQNSAPANDAYWYFKITSDSNYDYVYYCGTHSDYSGCTEVDADPVHTNNFATALAESYSNSCDVQIMGSSTPLDKDNLGVPGNLIQIESSSSSGWDAKNMDSHSDGNICNGNIDHSVPTTGEVKTWDDRNSS